MNKKQYKPYTPMLNKLSMTRGKMLRATLLVLDSVVFAPTLKNGSIVAGLGAVLVKGLGFKDLLRFLMLGIPVLAVCPPYFHMVVSPNGGGGFRTLGEILLVASTE